MYTLSWDMRKRIFLMRNKILANQMINDESKGVKSRHMWFGSIKSLTKGRTSCIHWITNGTIKCQTFNERILLAGQAVVQN